MDLLRPTGGRDVSPRREIKTKNRAYIRTHTRARTKILYTIQSAAPEGGQFSIKTNYNTTLFVYAYLYSGTRGASRI